MHTIKKQFDKKKFVHSDPVFIIVTTFANKKVKRTVTNKEIQEIMRNTVFMKQKQIMFSTISLINIPHEADATTLVDVWTTEKIPECTNTVNKAMLKALEIHSERCDILIKNYKFSD